MSRSVKVSDSVPIFLQLDDEDSAQFPQAVVMDQNGSVVAIKNLIAVPSVSGKYLAKHTFNTIGDYSIKFIVYSDVQYLTVSTIYSIGDETIRVSLLENNVETILNRDYKPPVADFG